VSRHKRPSRPLATLLMFGVITLAVLYVTAGAVVLVTTLK
jgi:hypothetical protein